MLWLVKQQINLSVKQTKPMDVFGTVTFTERNYFQFENFLTLR